MKLEITWFKNNRKGLHVIFVIESMFLLKEILTIVKKNEDLPDRNVKTIDGLRIYFPLK